MAILSVVLFLWLYGWSRHIWCAILLNNMDLHMSSLGTLVTEGPWCVFHATRCQVYWVLTHNVAFYWYSDLLPHTQTYKHTHTSHSGASRLTHPYKYLQYILCPQHIPILHYMIKWIWYQKFTFHNVFSFQQFFTCKSHVSVYQMLQD